MKISTKIIGLAVIVLAGVGAYLIFKKPATRTTVKPVIQDKQTSTNDETLNASDSSYIIFSTTALQQNSDKKRVLFFYANWCPTCRPADISFRENEDKIPDDLVLIRVNYKDSDTDQDEDNLAKQYGVTYQHTFVQINENGQVLTKWNGGELDKLLINIK
jgi:thiol-disulfide isomerase/thioredoxin